MYFQIFDNNDDLNNYQCIDGIYILQGEITESNFYFTTEEFLFSLLSDGNYVREIKLPTDNLDLKITQHSCGLGISTKWKSNQIILGKTYSLSDINTFKFLQMNGVDFLGFGYAVVEWASNLGYTKLVEFLIESGADIHVNDGSALVYSSSNGHFDIVKILLLNGANDSDNSALELSSLNGHELVVKLLLEYGSNANHCSALSNACSRGHLAIVKLLVESGADVNNGPTLRLASEHGHASVVKFLLESGVNNDYDALIRASECGHLSVVKILLLNGLNSRIDDSFCAAAKHGHLSVVKFLLESGADIHAKDDNAFYWACWNNHPDILKVLLKYGYVYEDYDTLERAVQCNHYKIVKILLKNGTNIPKNKDLLHQATSHGCYKVVELLLKYHIDCHANINDAFFWACYCGHFEVVELLLLNGADIHFKDNYVFYWTCYNATYSNKHIKIVELLLSNGADVNLALEYAINTHNLKMILLLMQYGANIYDKRDEIKELIQKYDDQEIVNRINELIQKID